MADVIVGYECPISGTVLTAKQIWNGYCDLCIRARKSAIGIVICGVAP